MKSQLRLGHPLSTLRATFHNGPGWRLGLWLQGCSLLCTKNCLNPHYLSPDGGFLFSVEEVADAIAATARRSAQTVEGITVLGGEPTDQIEPLTELMALVRMTALSTMVYTGYTIEALRRKFGVRAEALFAQLDLLKDGPFREDRYEPDLAWRGSDNQRLHCLSDRYSPEILDAAFRRQGKGFSIHVAADGTLSVSGLQNRAAAAAAESTLASTSST